MSEACPLYPQKRIFDGVIGMNALGPKPDIGKRCEMSAAALGAPIARCSEYVAGVAAVA